jgi:hypothetical protein
LAASIFHTGERSIGALKQYLAGRGVPVRLSRSARGSAVMQNHDHSLH